MKVEKPYCFANSKEFEKYPLEVTCKQCGFRLECSGVEKNEYNDKYRQKNKE